MLDGVAKYGSACKKLLLAQPVHDHCVLVAGAEQLQLRWLEPLHDDDGLVNDVLADRDF